MFDRITKWLVTAAVRTVGLLPLCVHHFNARWIGWVIEHVIKYRVDTVDDNLKLSFPDKSDSEREQIKHDFYRHFANIFLETIWFGSCRNYRRLRRSGIVRVANPEVLNHAMESCPGVVVMSSHAGNWELIGGIQNYDDSLIVRENTCCVVYRRLSSKLMGDIMAANRIAPLRNRKAFDGYLESREVLRYMLKHRDAHKMYVFITDQRPYFYMEKAPLLKFMGHDVLIMDGSATVAHRLGYACLYQRMAEVSNGRYVLEYVPICEDASQMEPMQIMQKYYELLEDDIRRQPHNYLWTHKRWWMG